MRLLFIVDKSNCHCFNYLKASVSHMPLRQYCMMSSKRNVISIKSFFWRLRSYCPSSIVFVTVVCFFCVGIYTEPLSHSCIYLACAQIRSLYHLLYYQFCLALQFITGEIVQISNIPPQLHVVLSPSLTSISMVVIIFLRMAITRISAILPC